ncbi:hypothetical protein BD779DRAFT_1551439 [Infundibulicybe gibba]|nr:hypothetical protein BD779DRAFT_1551439 [Infundibulicybe gibba]
MLFPNRLGVLVWVAFVHLAGVYLFTSGFLLTRLSLSDTTVCLDQQCTLPPTHKRAVLLIIDALRFDFVTPNPPEPASPFHHNILTLPRKLTASRPQHSFIFNAYADPPTTTLQRIKGLTTGSLPTFVDVGNNFGGSSIAEDSILKQLNAANKKAAFMGDDTWMSANMTFPFDSFNVEDLHTVDEGVIKHLFPLLEDPGRPFDFLVGHFLGVDHVGHRVGPDHPSMKAKLSQMNDVLTRVVDRLDDDTLLVVLGDHGMDRSGDHGGDGVLETSSAMWIYSKGPALAYKSASIPSGLLQYTTFPGTTARHRSIQQIDILPTLSLLLGLPIPFNNLGSVIPEVFWRESSGKDLFRALQINAQQVKAYLDAYRSSSSGAELDDAWTSLQTVWSAVQMAKPTGPEALIIWNNYNRVALAACRAMWAQFNPFLMSLGLALLGMSLVAIWALYSGLSDAKHDWNSWLSAQLPQCIRGMAGGAVLGFLAYLPLQKYLDGMDLLDCVLFASPFVSCIALIVSSKPNLTSKSITSIPFILILHTLSFLSNSFTFWEDRIVPFLLITSIVPFVLTGFTAPTTRLRYRILGFSLLFATCVRLMSISTVCREEQQPYCHVTFYASSSLPSPPFLVLLLAAPAALGLPFAIKRFLSISRSDAGIARSFLPFIITPSLVAGAAFWVIEWMDSAAVFGADWAPMLRLGRTWIARFAFVLPLVLGGAFWWLVPLCIDIEAEQVQMGAKRQVTIIGYANTFGSPLVYATTQLTGQITLALATIALIAYLEVVDSVRDVKVIEAAFANSTPSKLLEVDATPNESYPIQSPGDYPSLQWKSAFMLTPTLSYYLAAVTVALNTLGPIFLIVLAVPLVALWNRAPLPAQAGGDRRPQDTQVKGESTLAALGAMAYFAALLVGTAVSAAVLRRHLMVWKVFAPRFMAGALHLLAADLAVLLGVGVGLERILYRVRNLFRRLGGKA